MKKLFSIFSVALLAAASMTVSAAQFGYTDGTCTRDNMFRVGTSTAQGMAIRIPAEKVALLKGCTIYSVSAAFGSSRTTDGNVTVFIGTSPTENLAGGSFAISRALQWIDFPLPTPYVITGEEPELYIGYRGEISTASSLHLHDGNRVIPGTCYALSGSEWVDLADLGFGCPDIRFDLDGAPALTDAIIKPLDTDGFFKAETPYNFEGQLYNFGTEAIRSFDLEVTVGDNSPVTKHFDGLDVAPATNFDFGLDSYTSSYEGMLPMQLEIKNVNGAADSAPADNAFAGELCFYPRDMERSALLEGFTGQTCSNCPAGHTETHRWLETVPEGSVIQVMHHSGYQPDNFSMDADYDYTFFYGSTSTYAPATMMNRTVFPSISSYPTWGPGAKTLQTAYDIVMASQPYVSLNLESTYDPDTRQTTVTLKTQAHNDLPASTNIFNVMLVQDGMSGDQSGAGSGYVHDAVFRGTLTDNSWGKMIPSRGCKAGGEYEWSYTFTLPEEIFSDYWANFNLSETRRQLATHAVVPENMRIVAYVGALGGDDIAGHTVYNAVEVKLGQSHSQGGFAAIDAVDASHTEAVIVINGRRLAVMSEHDSVELFDLRGNSIDPTTELVAGFYIVRVTNGTDITTKKLIVR